MRAEREKAQQRMRLVCRNQLSQQLRKCSHGDPAPRRGMSVVGGRAGNECCSCGRESARNSARLCSPCMSPCASRALGLPSPTPPQPAPPRPTPPHPAPPRLHPAPPRPTPPHPAPPRPTPPPPAPPRPTPARALPTAPHRTAPHPPTTDSLYPWRSALLPRARSSCG